MSKYQKSRSPNNFQLTVHCVAIISLAVSAHTCAPPSAQRQCLRHSSEVDVLDWRESDESWHSHAAAQQASLDWWAEILADDSRDIVNWWMASRHTMTNCCHCRCAVASYCVAVVLALVFGRVLDMVDCCLYVEHSPTSWRCSRLQLSFALHCWWDFSALVRAVPSFPFRRPRSDQWILIGCSIERRKWTKKKKKKPKQCNENLLHVEEIVEFHGFLWINVILVCTRCFWRW